MRPILLALMLVALGCRSPVVAPPMPGVAADVAYLASPALQGRAAGTAGGDSAAAYIARHYERLGLAPAFLATCPTREKCAPSYFQFFGVGGAIAQNVAAVVPGTDPACANSYVVVGAHFDHLGRSTRGAADPQLGEAIRPGADDNASGTAAVMELGRRLAARPAPCPVLLVHFDAEELGLVGSRVFVEHLPVPRGSIRLMVNLDMVGRLRTGGLTLNLSAAPDSVAAAADGMVRALGLTPKHSTITAERSDHASFAHAGIPAIALFTGFHSDYHSTGDIAARVDVPGIERITGVAEAVVRGANRIPESRR